MSRKRSKTFRNHTDREEKAIALHNHTLQLGSSLMSMIALLELSLRNSTNRCLTDGFGDPEWLLSGHDIVPLKKFERRAIKTATTHARKAAYAKLSYKEKAGLDVFAFPQGVPADTSHKDAVSKRQSLFMVSHGQIISQTTFSFWKRLYAHEYEAKLWKTCLKKAFPNKRLKRSDVSKALEVVYATRNRVAHHEPVYGQRLNDAVTALDFLRNSLGARAVDDETSFKKFSRIQHLRLKMDYESFLDAWQTLT